MDRPTAIRNCLPDGSPAAYFEYDYDAAGRIVSVGRESGAVVYYGYDAADRLTGETWKGSGGGTVYAFGWDYDLVGNRTRESRDGSQTYYEYNAGNQLTRSHELAGDTWTYFAYDARGNCLRIDEPDGTTYFEYTAADMVSNIRYKTGASNYFHYDASLRRYAMEDSAGLSYFTWDDDGMELLAERDASAAVTAGYTHGETPIGGIGTLVAAAKDAGGGSTEYQYPIYDHRGSVVRLVNETGTVTATYEYDAWGNVLQDTETITTGSRFGYQSDWIRLVDSDGRVCLSPMRLYDVHVGRWSQRDPIGHGDGLNLYEYAASSPVATTDPSGLRQLNTGLKLGEETKVVNAILIKMTKGSAVNMSLSPTDEPIFEERAARWATDEIANKKLLYSLADIPKNLIMAPIKVMQLMLGPGIMKKLGREARKRAKKWTEDQLKRLLHSMLSNYRMFGARRLDVRHNEDQTKAAGKQNCEDAEAHMAVLYDQKTDAFKVYVWGKVGEPVYGLRQDWYTGKNRFCDLREFHVVYSGQANWDGNTVTVDALKYAGKAKPPEEKESVGDKIEDKIEELWEHLLL